MWLMISERLSVFTPEKMTVNLKHQWFEEFENTKLIDRLTQEYPIPGKFMFVENKLGNYGDSKIFVLF